MPDVIVNKNGVFIDTHVRYRTISDNLSKQEYKFLLTTTLTISDIETNKVKVSLTLLVSICNAMNVTVDYILGNEYKAPTTAFETELLNTVDKLDSSKKEQLLRIAKVL